MLYLNQKEVMMMLKRILKNILNIILFLCLLILSYLTIIRGTIIENANAKVDTTSITQIKKLLNYTPNDLHKIFDDILKENDIPTNIIDEIIENKAQKEVIDQYLNEVVEATQNRTEIPEIPKEKLKSLLTEAIQKYNTKYHTNISLDKIQDLINELIIKANLFFNLINQSIVLLNSLQIIFSDSIYYTVLILTLILILIMAITLKKEALFSLGGISIINGLILIGNYGVLKIPKLQNILKLIPFNLAEIEHSFLISGSAFIITGIFLFIMYQILIKHEKSIKKK